MSDPFRPFPGHGGRNWPTSSCLVDLAGETSHD